MSSASTTAGPTSVPCNAVILSGEVANEPAVRALKSGDTLLAFDLRIRIQDQPTQSLPVSWIGSKSKAPSVRIGRQCLVLGSVNRRFYRGGAGVQSRVDVRADRIIMGGPAKKRSALSRFLAARRLTQDP